MPTSGEKRARDHRDLANWLGAKVKYMNTLKVNFSSDARSKTILSVDGQSLLDHPLLKRSFLPLPAVSYFRKFNAIEELSFDAQSLCIECLIIGQSFNPGDGELFCDVVVCYDEMIWKNFGDTSPHKYTDLGSFRFQIDQVMSDLKLSWDATN